MAAPVLGPSQTFEVQAVPTIKNWQRCSTRFQSKAPEFRVSIVVDLRTNPLAKTSRSLPSVRTSPAQRFGDSVGRFLSEVKSRNALCSRSFASSPVVPWGSSGLSMFFPCDFWLRRRALEPGAGLANCFSRMFTKLERPGSQLIC